MSIYIYICFQLHMHVTLYLRMFPPYSWKELNHPQMVWSGPAPSLRMRSSCCADCSDRCCWNPTMCLCQGPGDNNIGVVVTKPVMLLMEEVRRSPVEVGTLAHYVQKICIPGGQRDFWTINDGHAMKGGSTNGIFNANSQVSRLVSVVGLLLIRRWCGCVTVCHIVTRLVDVQAFHCWMIMDYNYL